MKKNENLSIDEASGRTAKKNLARVILVIALLAAGAELAYQLAKKPAVIPPAPEPQLNTAKNDMPAAQPAMSSQKAANPPVVKPTVPVPAAKDNSSAELAIAGAVQAQEIITRLAQLDPTHGPLTKEQVKELNQSVKNLIAQGPAAVPAIRGFLERNQDINFTELADGNP